MSNIERDVARRDDAPIANDDAAHAATFARGAESVSVEVFVQPHGADPHQCETYLRLSFSSECNVDIEAGDPGLPTVEITTPRCGATVALIKALEFAAQHLRATLETDR